MPMITLPIHQPGRPAMKRERGFTLIEMLISMAMGLVLIAGLTSIFIADSNTSRVISARTERMGDLFLVSHLMQEALRESLSAPKANLSVLTDLSNRGVNTSSMSGYPTSDTTFAALPYWDATSKTLTYQDLEGNVGIFQYQRKVSGKVKTDTIYWLRPLTAGASGSSTFQELIRDLDIANGIQVYDPLTNNAVTTAIGGGMRIDLTSTYTNSDKQGKTLSLSFTIWPRN